MTFTDGQLNMAPNGISILDSNIFYGTGNAPFGRPFDHEYFIHSSLAVWHELDVAGGLDVWTE